MVIKTGYLLELLQIKKVIFKNEVYCVVKYFLFT